MRAFQVTTAVTLSYNPHPRRRGSVRQKEHAASAKLFFDEETAEGEVWFFDENNCRGFVSVSGGLNALLKEKHLKEIEYHE